MERVNWNQAVRPSTHDLIAAINSGADDIERIDGALDDIETALDGKAGVSGTYPDFVAGEALSIRSGIRSNTFLSRELDTDVADGIAEIDRILGNTVVWNQLVNTTDTSVTVTSGHKVFKRISSTASIATSDGAEIAVTGATDNVIDLTLMFGAGNEPSTVAEFEAMYGSDYKPYSAPALLSSHIAGIQGASACEFAAQTLRGIGTAQDVMTKAGIERVIGIIDLSDAYWSLGGTSESGVYRMQTNIVSNFIKRPASGGTVANIRCVAYPSISANNTYSKITGIAVETYGSITIFDPNINTTEAMHEAAQGLIVYYELATPTTETFETPLDLTYAVEADGTEAWVVPSGTAPTSAAVTGEIGYPVDPARAFISHDSFADFCDKLGAFISATITETWDGTKYTYAFASGRSALLGSIEAEPNALEVTEKDDIVKEIIEDERKEQ